MYGRFSPANTSTNQLTCPWAAEAWECSPFPVITKLLGLVGIRECIVWALYRDATGIILTYCLLSTRKANDLLQTEWCGFKWHFDDDNPVDTDMNNANLCTSNRGTLMVASIVLIMMLLTRSF